MNNTDKYYQKVIDIITDNNMDEVFGDIGKLLAKTNPRIFSELFTATLISNDKQTYVTMLNELGKLKTIKAYKENTGSDLWQSKKVIEQLAFDIGWIEPIE